MVPESFLADYVNKNIGSLGAVGRFPLGAIGAAFGAPGIGPNFEIQKSSGEPSLLGGLVGFGAKHLFS